jgi:DNA processing protein
MKNNELLYTILLTLIPNIGPVTGKKLITLCGSAENIFSPAGRQKLRKLKSFRMNLVNDIDTDSLLDKANLILETLEKNKINAFFYNNKKYPFRLKFIPDAPLILYSKGNIDLNVPRVISIIGTRQPTPDGLNTCRKIIQDLANYDPLIISGLAYGIDICAQNSALKNKLQTVSVLAHGHKYLYPPEHLNVAQSILKKGGLISEFEFWKKPERESFPMRNRLIAALSDACLVIESKTKGGSMITANLAFDYHKEVFAIPGKPSDTKRKGCNKLIKENKAMLVESADDIAVALNWSKPQNRQLPLKLIPNLTKEEQEIHGILKTGKEIQIEQITAKSSLTLDKINSTLLSLEFKGLIQSLPGKLYTLI